MKNNQSIQLEGSTGYLGEEGPYKELMNRVIEVAADDLLEAMLIENGCHFDRAIILHTPKMGICGDIPVDKNKKIVRGKRFKFPDYYKNKIIDRFKELKKN